jgi:hypothetical protein
MPPADRVSVYQARCASTTSSKLRKTLDTGAAILDSIR